jgi:putative ABC transport system permease protein
MVAGMGFRYERGFLWLAEIGQDARYAIRQLRRNRGFAAVAIMTLALGIGVNTSVFSVVYGVLLNPYPYADPEKMWVPSIVDEKDGREVHFVVGDYLEMAGLPGVASAMATTNKWVALTGAQAPEMVAPALVSGSAFGFLGVPPLLGRGITPSDFDSNGEAKPVAVLNYRLWQARFNGDPAIVGQTITLDDAPFTVIGVMPPRFDWYTRELWLPLSTTDRTRGALTVLRFKPGIAKEIAEQRLRALSRRLAAEAPERFPKGGVKAVFTNYLDATVFIGKELRTSLHLLFFAVGFLLLIACASVANLLLARGATRRREIATRLALGSSRGRLMRELMMESTGLALLGGLLGVLFAFALTRVIVVLMPSNYMPDEARVTLNGCVLAFAVCVSMLTGILFGLVPAFQNTRSDVNEALRDGGHISGGGRGARMRDTLVVIEVALSLVLLVGATQMVRGFVDLEGIDPGFRTQETLMLRMPFAPRHYPTLERRIGFVRTFLERVQALPGVVSAVIGTVPDLDSQSPVTMSGKSKAASWMPVNFVGSDYFDTLRIEIRTGRNFTPQEIARGDHVALISESAARLWTDGASPIGRTISVDALAWGSPSPNASKDVAIIGVVADTRARNLRNPPPRVVFVPYTLRGLTNSTLFVVRTHGNPTALVNPIRAALRSLDPDQPMMLEGTGEHMDDQMAQPRFNMVLFGSLAGVALALAAAGIYSVLSYNVAQRTREIGIRMALGAQRGNVVWLTLSESLFVVLIGAGIGVPAAIGSEKLISSRLSGLTPIDPLLLAMTVLLMFAVGILASYVPTRRATNVDPLAALREE